MTDLRPICSRCGKYINADGTAEVVVINPPSIAATIERCAQWLEANDQPVLAENMRVGLKQQGY